MSPGAWLRTFTVSGSLPPRDHRERVPVIAPGRISAGRPCRGLHHQDGYVEAMNPIASHPDGVSIRVLVVPGASRTEVKGLHGDSIRVRVAAPPEGGRANLAVIDLLERTVGGRAEILSGETSRNKVVLIRGVHVAAASGLLSP
jgi:uncharacterized protein (TIGR00251 family)